MVKTISKWWFDASISGSNSATVLISRGVQYPMHIPFISAIDRHCMVEFLLYTLLETFRCGFKPPFRDHCPKNHGFFHIFLYTPGLNFTFALENTIFPIYFHEFPIPIHVRRPGPMSMSCRRVVGCASATSLRSWWPRWACRCAVARRKFTPWLSPGGVPPRYVNVGEQKP